MQSPDTMLIYEKPDAYFFPRYQDRVFAPFGVPQPSLRYLLYRILHLLHLPGIHLFWGAWKIHAKTAKRIIIFDYGYQRGMERYIRSINPDCQVYLFFWNKVNSYNKRHLRFSSTDAVFSTDPEDCAKYDLKYNHIFYPREYYIPDTHTPDTCPSPQHRLFFLGTDKGRAPYIASLKHVLEDGGLDCDIRILISKKDPAYRKQYQELLTDTRLSYDEYLTQIKSCHVLLDINQKGQSALTMRVMEAIYLSKKLITNNSHILTYDFYDPDNILVLPENTLPIPEGIRHFLDTPFRPYPDTVLNHYSFEHWLQGFA